MAVTENEAERRPDVDALIVGAGPTGLALAAQLERFGASFRLVDRLEDRTHESRALAIQPRSLEVLAAAGVARTLVERGNDSVEVRLYSGERVVPIRLFELGLEDTAYPFLLFLSQAETERVLGEHLAGRGVRVERGVELVDFNDGGRMVRCRLRHADGRTEEVGAQYLVGCDGAHSTVRHLSGIAFEGGAYPQTFALADLEVEGELEPGCVHAWPGAVGILFFFPLEHPATWRLQVMVPGSGAEDGSGEDRESGAVDGESRTEAGESDAASAAAGSGDPSLERLQAIVDGFTGGGLRLHDPVWRTRFRIPRRQAVSYRSGRVFLAGDAAHVHSPAGAQGMNTGIQDAWNLGWKLALVARGHARPALLDSYESERWPVGRFVLRLSHLPFRVATSANPLLRFLRTRIVPRVASLARHFDRGRAFAFRRIAQLEVRYRESPIALEGHPRLRHGPRAGDRLPDAELVLDGSSTTLHREVADPRFHVLLCGPVDAWDARRIEELRERHGALVTTHYLTREPTPGALVDTREAALARLAVDDAAHYLVRPDGHVAYRAGGTDLEGLSAYVARWFPGATRP